MADPEQTLDAVLGSVLTALTGAQDQSNRLSRAVALDYRQDALLRRFAVPVGTVEEAEFDVVFAIDGVAAAVSGPGREGDPAGAPAPAVDPQAAVRTAVGLVVRALHDMADHAQDAGRGEEVRQIARLAAATAGSRFADYLLGEVDQALDHAREQAQLAGRGTPDAAAERRTILGVLEQRLLDHPDLAALIGTATRRGGQLRDRIAGALDTDPAAGGGAAAHGTTAAMAAPAPSPAASPAPGPDARTGPTLHVAVEAGVLARLPEGILDRMKVHTTMHGMRWKMVRDEDGKADYVLDREG